MPYNQKTKMPLLHNNIKFWKFVDGKWVKKTQKEHNKSAKKKKNKQRHLEQVHISNKRFKRCQPLIAERKEAERSPMEKKIELFLMHNEISFIPEYYDKNLFNKNTNNLLFFDFYLPDYHAAIEYDGMHHFKPIHGKAALDRQKNKDKAKNNFCVKNKIRLLRIPYWQSHEFEDLITNWFDKHF